MTQHPVEMPYLKKIIKATPYLLPALVLLYFVSQPAITDSPNGNGPRIGIALENLIANQQHPLLLQQDFSRQSAALKQLYGMNANQLIWLGEGLPQKNRDDALAILSDAAADGLIPANYDAEPLRHYLKQASSLPASAADQLASIDLALSVSVLRFIEDLRTGRIDPSELNYPSPFGANPAFDASALLKHHLELQSISELPRAAAPNLTQYRQLKQALANLRRSANMATHTELDIGKTLRPGDQHPQLPQLRRRLWELGELTDAELAVSGDFETLYDETSIAAVERLQQQQGLNSDGIIGKQTLAILNQPPTEKITLLELAMERLRWLPEFPDGPMIVVNIPAYQLWAYNSQEDQDPLTMKVIVGKADNNQTPMLWEEMKYLEFNPYWNIPTSIMKKEILPKMLTDYDYLSSQDIELVAISTDNESEYLDNIIHDLNHGKARGRQRPGKKNPLGRVKFIFPNLADVYLHDTPGKAAFNKDRRDLSHGCVRVAKADKLAEFVLNDPTNWDTQTIEEAMSGTKTRRVSLQKPIPVLFFYTTAYVDRDDKPHFYPDIYDQDTRLLNALNRLPGTTNGHLLTGKTSHVSG